MLAGCFGETNINDPGDNGDPDITPGEPASPEPDDNASNQETAVILRWSADDAVTYDVYFDDVNPPVNLIADDTSSTSLVLSGLSSATTYYWRVISTSSTGNVTNGDVWRFTTKSSGSTSTDLILTEYSFSYGPPNIVTTMFQVSDEDGNGIDDLTQSDFNVYENGVLVSSEAQYELKKRDETPYTLRTVLVLDNSSSLQSDITLLKSAATTLVNNMSNQQEIALYIFSEDPVLIQDFTSDRTALKNAISSITSGFSTTDLYGATVTGASRLTEAFTPDSIIQSAMILFTDGRDTQNPQSEYNNALVAVSGKQVYTVGLGGDIEPEVLEALGTAGFYSVSDISGLADQFVEINNEIDKYANSFYVLEFMSPKRGNADHTLTIEIDGNTNSGIGALIVNEFNSKDFFSVADGIYVNPDVNNPTGITVIEVDAGTTETFEVVTYGYDSSPHYNWNPVDPSIVSIITEESDNSVANIEASGSAGAETNITVTDVNNNISTTFTFRIK